MADLDFGAPSFSLGLDLDFDFDSDPPTSPTKQSSPSPPKSSENSSINAKFPNFGDDDEEDFQLNETLDPDPPPVLKRLRRRRPRSPPLPPAIPCREPDARILNAEDEIENFSSQEDRGERDECPSVQNRSACSSSKFSLHSQRILTTQSASKLKTKKNTPASSASTFASMEGSSNKGTLPKLTTSPLRKIQLLDSDSDDPLSSEDQPETFMKFGAYTKRKQCSPTQAVARNQQNIEKKPSNMLQNQSLWKDFSPKKSTKLATPALDEFCEEYFRSMKDKNLDHRKKGDIGNSRSRSLPHDQFLDETEGSFQENIMHENGEDQHDNRPSAYRYFYHNDPMIQKLVRDRLPNFFPVGAVNHKGSEHSETTVIDYMSQFGHRDVPTEVHVTRNRGNEGSSKTKKRSRNNANVKGLSQASEGWVNPRTSATIPRNAGKRRVRADGRSAGHWFTGQDGRKVYVSKNGQELTGQAAYRHYRKESGAGSRRSRKKAAPKKKSKR